MNNTDPRLTLISSRIRELNQEIDSLLWAGKYDPRKVSMLESELERLTELSLKGELYEPNF